MEFRDLLFYDLYKYRRKNKRKAQHFILPYLIQFQNKAEDDDKIIWA